MTELSVEGAKAVYSEIMGTSSDNSQAGPDSRQALPDYSDKDWKNWKVFMQMILTWEEKNEDAKRQFLSKLRSIPFADMSDTDKVQQIADGQTKGQFVQRFLAWQHL